MIWTFRIKIRTRSCPLIAPIHEATFLVDRASWKYLPHPHQKFPAHNTTQHEKPNKLHDQVLHQANGQRDAQIHQDKQQQQTRPNSNLHTSSRNLHMLASKRKHAQTFKLMSLHLLSQPMVCNTCSINARLCCKDVWSWVLLGSCSQFV